jgi:hypothetical protein
MLKRIAPLVLLIGMLLSQIGSPLRADRHRGYEITYRVTYSFPEEGINIIYPNGQVACPRCDHS